MITTNKNNYPDPDDIDTTNVVPYTECTGVVPAQLNDSDCMEAFTEICDIPDQKDLGTLEDVPGIIVDK